MVLAISHRIADLGSLLAAFFEQAHGILLLCCAADGTILDCNPAVGALLGPGLVGRLLWDHLTEPDAARLRARIAAAERRPEEPLRLNVCDPSHGVHTFECHVDLRPGGFVLVGERSVFGGEPLHGKWLALNNELTLMARERGQALARAQQARAEAETANRRKDDILAMVSHDLRQPLTAILAWSRLLASGHLGEEHVIRAAESIQRNAEIQASLVEDLLDLARAQAGRLRFNPRPVDPAKVVESILETARPAAEVKGVSLERVVTDGSELFLLADPARLEQALSNLVANAVKFTPAGGRVEVRLGEEGDGVAIHIQDTGEGIDPALLPYIFDRFRQGQGAGIERKSGLGLGLAIARDLIELHGGSIEAASDGPGQGATFTVKLPKVRADEPEAAALSGIDML
jgi:signal transduction histidine kinase